MKKNENNHLIFDKLDESESTIANLYSIAENEKPIWGYIDILHPKNSIVVLAFFNNETYNCYGMIRREGKYLSRYLIDFNKNDEMVLRLQEICYFNNENFKEWYKCYISNFNEIYIDNDSITPEIQRYIVNLSEEDLEEYLKTHRTMPITEDYFIKK